MVVFLWIWKFIGPLVMLLGALYFGFVLFNPNWEDIVPMELTPACIWGGVCALGGIILGCTGWAEEVAPRMFWVRSRVELFDSKFGYALTMGIQMFFLPSAIVFAIMLISAA